jgi:hypothetical protein
VVEAGIGAFDPLGQWIEIRSGADVILEAIFPEE